MRPENEDLRLTVKVQSEQVLYEFENLMKAIFGKENVEIEQIRKNERPSFGNFFTFSISTILKGEQDGDGNGNSSKNHACVQEMRPRRHV